MGKWPKQAQPHANTSLKRTEMHGEMAKTSSTPCKCKFEENGNAWGKAKNKPNPMQLRV